MGGLAEVSLQPDQILPVRAAHQAGILHAVVGLVEAPGPRAAPGCADLVVNSIHLRIGEVLIGTAHLAQAGADRQTSPTAVRVGELSMEPGSPPVAEAYIREQLRFRGELCARRASERDGAMRGSVIVELEAREPGRMVRPSAPLDSLQQPPLLFCLLNALYDDPELARSLPGGAHFYAPFYFTPDDSARLLIHSQAP